jgi:hypothetical protein
MGELFGKRPAASHIVLFFIAVMAALAVGNSTFANAQARTRYCGLHVFG